MWIVQYPIYNYATIDFRGQKKALKNFTLTERDNVGSIELMLSKLRSASFDVGVGFGDVVVDSVPDGIFFGIV